MNKAQLLQKIAPCCPDELTELAPGTWEARWYPSRQDMLDDYVLLKVVPGIYLLGGRSQAVDYPGHTVQTFMVRP